MLELLLPTSCAACSCPGTSFCSACVASLARLSPPLCARCGAATVWPVERCAECAGRRLAFASARAAIAYDETGRALVRAWKERGLRTLARVAADVVADTLARPAVAAVAFVPPDRDRVLKRGHHPAQRLARELAERWDLPLEPLLRRPRVGPPQRGLPLAERRRNVRGAFAATGRVPARVCLVDDVYTTGATVDAAASALRKGGARRVEVVTLARTIRSR